MEQKMKTSLKAIKDREDTRTVSIITGTNVRSINRLTELAKDLYKQIEYVTDMFTKLSIIIAFEKYHGLSHTESTIIDIKMSDYNLGHGWFR